MKNVYNINGQMVSSTNRGQSNGSVKYVIDKIKLKHKITEYLSNRGIHARIQDHSKSVYHCPLPGHTKDNSPSFYIYDKGDHEDYWCFGCKSGGSIVNFVAEFEQIGIRKAIDKLSEGIGIKVEDILDSLVLDIANENNGDSYSSPHEALEYSFCLNKALNDYLRAVNFNEDDVKIAESVGKLIDKYLYAENTEELKKIFEDGNKESISHRIKARIDLFNSQKQENEIKAIKETKIGEIDV